MALLITCPDCETENRVEDGKKGKNVPCKTCGASFKVGDDAKFVADPSIDKKPDAKAEDDDDKPAGVQEQPEPHRPAAPHRHLCHDQSSLPSWHERRPRSS